MDILILELLASKICHDLISPIGAVNNGIELMEEMGPDGADEATKLIAYSAGQASAKLQAYRLAYGAGGADSTHKPEDMFKAIAAVIGPEGKVTQDWDPRAAIIDKDEMGAYPQGFCKILISLMLLGLDCMPRGGVLNVSAGANGNTTLISARGTDAGMREGIETALHLKTPRADLHPKLIYAYVCGLLAQNYGYTLAASSENGVTFTITRVAA